MLNVGVINGFDKTRHWVCMQCKVQSQILSIQQQRLSSSAVQCRHAQYCIRVRGAQRHETTIITTSAIHLTKGKWQNCESFHVFRIV
jgi:GTP cyclohydrolase I